MTIATAADAPAPSTGVEAGTMRALVFHAPGDIRVEEVPRPRAGAGEATTAS